MAAPLRSFLFCSPLEFQASGIGSQPAADVLCLDLEDAVPPDLKPAARREAGKLLDSGVLGNQRAIFVRINEIASDEGKRDAQWACDQATLIKGIILPKVRSPADILMLAECLERNHADIGIHPIIEEPEGLKNVFDVLEASPYVRGSFFGANDLSVGLGCEPCWDALLYARSRLVHAAAIAGIPACDAPSANLNDLDALRADCLRARSLGMSGKVLKTAAHVRTANQCFTPSRQELEKYRAIYALYMQAPASPVIHEGKFIELPLVKRAKKMSETDWTTYGDD